MNPVPERPILGPPTSSAPPALLAALGGIVRSLISTFGEYGFRINRTLPKDGSESMTGPLELAEYLVATRPAAADYPGTVIYVSDGGAGAVFQGSNGTSWINLG